MRAKIRRLPIRVRGSLVRTGPNGGVVHLIEPNTLDDSNTLDDPTTHRVRDRNDPDKSLPSTFCRPPRFRRRIREKAWSHLDDRVAIRSIQSPSANLNKTFPS